MRDQIHRQIIELDLTVVTSDGEKEIQRLNRELKALRRARAQAEREITALGERLRLEQRAVEYRDDTIKRLTEERAKLLKDNTRLRLANEVLSRAMNEDQQLAAAYDLAQGQPDEPEKPAQS